MAYENGDVVNYCHDKDIERAAQGLSPSTINRMRSVGEGAYNSGDVAESIIDRIKAALKRNKENQPKSRLSKKQKGAIINKHNQG